MRIAEEERLRKEALTKSMQALESLISEWGKAKAINGFFSELRERVESAPEHEKAQLIDRIEAARALVKVPDVIETLKDWQTPEERYAAKKDTKTWF